MPPFEMLLQIRAFTAWMIAIQFTHCRDFFVKIHERLAAFALRAENLMLESAPFILFQLA